MADRSRITALDRKVNRPRVALRNPVVKLTKPEKCLLTMIFGVAVADKKKLLSTDPAMMGYNFGALYSTLGYYNLSRSSLRLLRQYLKKYNIEDWTKDER